MHEDVPPCATRGIARTTREPRRCDGERPARGATAGAPAATTGVVRPAADPFSATGGLKLLTGNLGPQRDQGVRGARGPPRDRGAGARLRQRRRRCSSAFKAGELERDFVCVVRWQGPQANGMPELHKLTPPLAVLQGKGFRVALVTDGRMSGASGKVPAAIHVSARSAAGGPLAKVRDGDMIRLDAVAGTLQALVTDGEWAARETADRCRRQRRRPTRHGLGRELFAGMRRNVHQRRRRRLHMAVNDTR